MERIGSSVRKGFVFFLASVSLFTAISIFYTPSASAYTADDAGVNQHCTVQNHNRMGDYLFITPRGGSGNGSSRVTISVPQNATTAQVDIRARGKYCWGSNLSSTWAGGVRSESPSMTMNGGTIAYPSQGSVGAYNFWTSSAYLTGTLNVNGWQSGAARNITLSFETGATYYSGWEPSIRAPQSEIRVTLQRFPVWRITASTAVQAAPNNSMTLGGRLGFQHNLRNTGNNTNNAVRYTAKIVRLNADRISGSGARLIDGTSAAARTERDRIYAASVLHSSAATAPTNRPAGLFVTNYRNANTMRTIQAADVGRWICSYIEATPSARDSSNRLISDPVRSNPRCNFINENYNLTPTISNISSNTIEPGSSITVTGSVAKTGNRAASHPTDTRYVQIIHKNGQPAPARPGAADDSRSGCAYYGVPASRCTSVVPSANGDNFLYRTTGATPVRSMTLTIPSDFEPGDRICFGMSVSGFNLANGATKSNTRHSALTCITMGKKPKVHVIGGDLYVGRGTPSASRGNISTSVSQLSRQTATGETTDDVNQRADNAQREWLFGVRGKISFNSPSGSTTGFTTGVAANTNVSVAGEEGVTVATDGSGTVRFVTDGLRIYRANGTVMPYNGSTTYDMGANGSTTQAAATFPIGCADSAPCNRYAVVTSSAATEHSRMGNLRYSIVDIDSGTVLRINRPFGPQGGEHRVGEALSVAPIVLSGSAETGYWVVANLPGFQTMRSFKVPYSWDGEGAINEYVDSFKSGGAHVSTGVTSGKRDQTYAPGFGTINFSTDFTRSIIAMSKTGGTAPGSVRIMNFNKATGIFTQQYAWNVPANTGTHPAAAVYSGDFSQNGQYAYVSTLYTGNGSRQGQVFRYRLTGTNATVASSVTLLNNSVTGNNLINGCTGAFGAGGAVKRGPDGSIYVAGYSCPYVFRVSQAAANGAATPTLSRFNLGSGAVSSFGLPQTAAMLRSLPRPAEYYGESYGSWAEYGIAASRQVNGMASAAGYAGGLRQTGTTSGSVGSPSLCMLSFLTFSNRAASGSCAAASIGYYTPPTSRTAAEYYEGRSTATLPLRAGDRYGIEADLASGVYLPRNGSAIALSASTLSAGKSVVIYAPNNDVVIEGNQSYDGGRSLSSISQIPQLVIIARNIRINENVSNVDAWLIAKTAGAGNIYTCGTITAPTQSECTNRLTVNGPVLSNKLYMLRTAGAGAGADAAAPAEVFNLRPDAYLWGVSQGSGNGRIPTASVKELPPRF